MRLPEAQGGLPPGPRVLGTRTSHGRTVRTASCVSPGYDDHPEKLQAAIDTIYERAHQTIADVDGVEVLAVPLFRALDGTGHLTLQP